MKELSIEEKAKRYNEAIERAESIYNEIAIPSATTKGICTYIFPELKESEDERIRKGLIKLVKKAGEGYENVIDGVSIENAIAWLEKQGEQKTVVIIPKFRVGDKIRRKTPRRYDKDMQVSRIGSNYYLCNHLGKFSSESISFSEESNYELVEQKPCMIQWKGDNLKEVVGFTGKDKNFDKWFKSFEEYEKYIDDHNGIFKIFNEDGSHYEVPIGAWIVKTPDGRNVASKAVFKNKSTEWTEEDEKLFKLSLENLTELKDRFGKDYGRVGDCIDWLKSLRPQKQWKPSIAQLNALSIVSKGNAPDDIEAVVSLYKDLKKLREE